MADYSVNATQLSAPQGAGAVTVKPVEGPSIAPILNVLGGAADIFAKGLDNKAKEDAKKRETDIVGQYVKEQSLINDAVAQGMDAGTAASRSRASANKFFAAYPEYYKEFKAAGDALKGTTELGAVEEQEKMERELQKGRITRAQTAGYTIDLQNMPKELVEKQLSAHEAGVRADAELQKLYARNEEARKQGNYNAGVAAQESKTTSIRLINEIAGAQVDAITGFVTHTAASVKSGKLTPEEAQLNLNKEFMKINAAIQSAASVNPELAAPYRSLFGDIQKLGMDMLDPKKQVEDVQNQIKLLVDKQKLIMVSTPQFAAITAASELLGANAQVALSAGNLLTPTIAAMIKSPAGSGEYVPQVVANPNVENDAIKFIKEGLTNMGKYKDQPKAKQEISNVINHTLTQMGEQFNKGGTTAAQMSKWADLLASSEYGKFASEGLIDKQAAQTVERVFQLNYETTIKKGINQKFDNFLYGQAGNKNAPKTIGEAIDVQFSGSGVLFTPKKVAGLDPVEMTSQVAAVKDLNSAQKAINQIIHMGAHLEGSTDYQKYWNERKHIILPGIFPNPTMLKEGQEVDGYIYIGGPYGNPASWRPAQK